MDQISTLIVLIGIVLMVFVPEDVRGHGTDIDTVITSMDDKKVKITTEITNVTESKYDIVVTISEADSSKAIENIVFFIEMKRGEESLFHERFIAHDGILRITVQLSNESMQIDGIWDESFKAWNSKDNDSIFITGSGLGLRGLHTFEIGVEDMTDAGSFLDMVRTDVSVAEDVTHIQNNTVDSIIEFETRSYFDTVTDFKYDLEEKNVFFSIPFDWNDDIISHVPVVHIEVRFPKDFAEFHSAGYAGTANGVNLFDSSLTIDDYTIENTRIIHYVLLGDHLRYIKNVMEKNNIEAKEIMFTLNKTDVVKFPFTAMTHDEQFQIDLSWDPTVISDGNETKFIFTIRDGATGEPLRQSSYDFIIMQSGAEIYKVSDIAVVGGDYKTYVFDDGQTGSTVIRFENIRGTGQEIEFAVMVVPELGTPVLILVIAVTTLIMLRRSRIMSI